MITRYAIECLTCAERYQVRINIGHRARSLFTFPCNNCTLPISLCFIKDQKSLGFSLEPEENVKIIELDTGIPRIINIHPDLLIPFSEIGNEFHQSLTQYRRLFDAYFSLTGQEYSKKNDLYALMSYGVDLDTEVKERYDAYVLHVAGKHELVESKLANRTLVTGKNVTNVKALDYLLDISRALWQPGLQDRFKSIKQFYSGVRKKPGYREAARYLDSTREERIKKYLNSIRLFVDAFDDLGKVAYYERLKLPISGDSVSVSLNFDKIKNLYGDAFETIMDMAIVPAVLNNVHNGRRYDAFATMDLGKYLTIDKAGKLDCIESNEKLKHLLENIESSIRNGSHHGNIAINKTRTIIEYQSGRPPKPKSITVAEYLGLTYKLFMDIFQLMYCECAILMDKKFG